MKVRFFLLFIWLVFCSTVLYAQMIDEAILISAARISRELPVNTTVGIIYFSSNSSNFNEYILNELNGAILRNRRIIPSRPKENQMQSIEENLLFDNTGTLNAESAQLIGQLMGVQYLLTGTIQLTANEYRLIFNVINTSNTEERNQFSTQVDLRNDQRFNQRNFGDLRNLLSGGSAQTGAASSVSKQPQLPVITEISVFSAETSVARGWTQSFTVTVAGSGNYDRSVTWAVDSSNENTNINNEGILTVAPDEVKTTLTINATSVFNPEISGTATISIRTATVTEVIVSPNNINIEKGKKQSFSAIISGDEEPPQNVTWSVTGASSSKTTISNNGILSVASNETGTKITVQATSVFDNQKSGTATITLLVRPPVNFISIEVSILGGGIRYLRSLSNIFELGVNAYWQTIDATVDTGVLAIARIYPGNSIFYVELGTGYGYREGGIAYKQTTTGKLSYYAEGFLINPTVGLRFNRNTKKFFIDAFLGIPIVLGERNWKNFDKGPDGFTSVGIRFGIGIDYTW